MNKSQKLSKHKNQSSHVSKSTDVNDKNNDYCVTISDEELDHLDKDEETAVADFKTLLKFPISQDEGFKFKHEKSWDNVVSSKYSHHFTLNLQSLEKGLSCIPFYLRHNIDPEFFNVNELNVMNKESDENKNTYLNSLSKKQTFSKRDDVTNTIINILKSDNSNENNSKDSSANQDVIRTSESRLTNINYIPVSTNEDLEQWLDDILND